MTVISRRAFAGLAACACLPAAAWAQAPGGSGKYVCPPCGCSQDGKVFDTPGVCPDPAYGMTLVPQSAEAPPQALPEGRSTFAVPGGPGREARRIGVHVYRSRRFTPDSPVLLVLPGAGRNADDYLDAWIATADAKGLLVAALSYPEADYDFAAYQMGGVIRNLRFPAPPGSPSVIRLRDEDITFETNPDPAQWIFADFDRVFDLLARASGSARTGYDLFGHSAGGQILHRLALFRPRSKAERIVAANAGLYTVPDLAAPQPFGLKDSGLDAATLKVALGARLTLLLGEKDDGDEAGGIQLRTPIVDRQGVGRLARGRAFYAAGERQAKALKTAFNWKLEVVPNVGHDYRRMSAAAAKRLYG
jgi:pimeloyl-ACP methyl ester carboxylesterase